MSQHSTDTLPYIGESRIRRVLQWDPLIDTMERAMISFSAGEVAQPVRQMVPVPGHDAIIVACTTSATEPVVEGAWPKPGAFVSAVGWNSAEGRELDDTAMANTVIVESTDAARDQAGNIRGSGCEIFAEIGEIFSGTKVVPEHTTVIFDSVGIAIMDVAAAKLVYDLVTDST